VRALQRAGHGKRDVHGEAPEATAARELEEELGLRAHRWVRLAELYDSPGFCDEYAYVFAALDLVEGGSAAPQGPEERAMTVERVPLDDAETLIASRQLVDAKTIIGLLLARRYLAGEYDGIVV
jgi:ADP-ribose pyrophosphatase